MKKFTQIAVVVVNLEIVPFQVTLASYRVIVGGFVPVKAFSKSQKLLFVSASSFLFYITYVKFVENLFKTASLS